MRALVVAVVMVLVASNAVAGELSDMATVLKLEDTRATAAEIGRFVEPGHDAEVRRRARRAGAAVVSQRRRDQGGSPDDRAVAALSLHAGLGRCMPN